jgi:hypothetical protein
MAIEHLLFPHGEDVGFDVSMHPRMLSGGTFVK